MLKKPLAVLRAVEPRVRPPTLKKWIDETYVQYIYMYRMLFRNTYGLNIYLFIIIVFCPISLPGLVIFYETETNIEKTPNPRFFIRLGR